jgi:hypothetical protein
VGSGSTTTQIVAKVDTAPAPESPAFSVAIGAPPVAVSVVAPVPPANAEVEVLFANFVDAYESGRLDAFAALFDEDADTNMRRGRAAIRGEYDELFRLSQWRRMQLTALMRLDTFVSAALAVVSQQSASPIDPESFEFSERVIGEKARRSMRAKIKYNDEPLGKPQVIPDFLPSPGRPCISR